MTTPIRDPKEPLPTKAEADAHRDPLTSEPGSHPVGAGMGAVAAGTAGAAIGSMAGPVGAVAGAVIGGLAGGIAGKEMAENINPTNPLVEDEYWRLHYQQQPYVNQGEHYELFQPAYKHGWEGRSQCEGRTFEEAEAELRRDWESSAHCEQLEWERAKRAAEDAWRRVEGARPSQPR